MISIVDYGTSNLGSMQNMLSKIGAESFIASRPEQLRDARKIIVPGVGAFDAGMRKLNETGMVEALNERVLVSKVPVLGVCLGMQLMALASEEGVLPGLGWVGAKIIRFEQAIEPNIRVPHMGWNDVALANESQLGTGLVEGTRFYFAHSYYLPFDAVSRPVLVASHGRTQFVAAFQQGNIFGAQFHPEKSHRFGMWLLRNFVERVPRA